MQFSNLNPFRIEVFCAFQEIISLKNLQKLQFRKVFKVNNLRALVLLVFLMIPVVGFSEVSFKKNKKAKTAKTIKRNILDIEFGTFKYESPFIAKKSIFIG